MQGHLGYPPTFKPKQSEDKSAHDMEIKARLLPLFLLFGLLGVGFLVFGYYQYITNDDPTPPFPNPSASPKSDQPSSTNESGGDIHE
jgi:hypothetical protein